MALCYQETVVWSVSTIQPMASAASQVSLQKQGIRLSVGRESQPSSNSLIGHG